MKMGRSKFPGKPSKHSHRKRVNVLPSTGELTNIVDTSPVTVKSISEESKQEDKVDENEGESASFLEELKPLKRRLPPKLNTSLRKDGRKRTFMSKIRSKGIKVNKATRGNTISRSLTRKETTNLVGKFVLPTRSVHSSRVIKPNKRFIDLNDSLTIKKKVIAKRQVKQVEMKTSIKVNKCNEEGSFNNAESDKTAFTNGHRVILRQARLKLPNQTSTQGPFSTKPHNGPGTIICGVCGAVRYYRFVKQARKFNIYSCESCRKFISKQIKRQSVANKNSNNTVICHKGQGTCYVPPVVRSQHWKITKCAYRSRCPACWLKMCLRAYQLTPNLKQNLTQLLPKNMRGLDLTFNNILPPLLWQKNIENPLSNSVPISESITEVTTVKQRPVRFKTQKPQGVPTPPPLNSDIKRQKIDLKGPRVKHVCRSASIVLGQPLAIFSNETEKKCDIPDQPVDIKIISDESKVNTVNKNDLNSLSEEELAYSDKMSKINYILNETTEISVRKDRSGNSSNAPSFTETKTCVEEIENLNKNGIYLDYSGDLNLENYFNNGCSVIGSEKFSINAICFLCGSGGKEPMLVCSLCCEPYHVFCMNNLQNRPLSKGDGKEYAWVCMKCTKCSGCNNNDRTKIGCPKCLKYYHQECFNPRWDTNITRKAAVCRQCMNCKECGTSYNVKQFPGNIPLCVSCINKRRCGMFCPICHHSVDDSKCCFKMLECLKCKKWVHSICEKLTSEEYEIFKLLPESVEFICSICVNDTKPSWKQKIYIDMRSCFNRILQKLANNKYARNLLKYTSKKQNHLRTIRKLHFSNEEIDLDNNNYSKDLPDINKIYSFEENEKLENETRSTNTLLDIRNKIYYYSSVKQFHKDMQEVLKVKSEEAINIYKKIFQDTFPWFGQAHEEAEDILKLILDVPHNDSQVTEESISVNLLPVLSDTRTCLLCKKVGDGLIHEESRLLYCGNNEWVHANCAYWSFDVYEEIDNHLQNVHLTIKKIQSQKCTLCNETGASIQCYTCAKESYHFMCAKKANCFFTKPKACFCPRHPPTGIISPRYVLKTEKDFELRRSVFIEQETVRIRAEIERVNYLVGSLSVTNLGKIEPIVSDSADAIIPMGFVCSRLFWSTVEPWKLVPYTITTSVQNPNCSTLTVDKNFTVDHTLNKTELEKIMKELISWQKEHDKSDEAESEDEEEKNGADLLSPELTDTILEDLPHDILDGISVQDIFPNFNYEDMLSLDNSNTESIAETYRKPEEEENIELDFKKEITRSKAEFTSLHKVDLSKSRAPPQRSCSLTLSCKLDSTLQNLGTLSPTIKKRKIAAARDNNMYYHLLQVDGNCDDSSSSECGSPTGLSSTDTWENYVSEEPVTCEKCQCTYRTKASYKRHLDSCEVLCTSESDSENIPETTEPQEQMPSYIRSPANLFENASSVMVEISETTEPVLISSYESYQSEVHTSVMNGQNYMSALKSAEVITVPQSSEILTHVEQKPLLQTVPVNTVAPIPIKENTIETSHEQAYTISQPTVTISNPSPTISIPNNQFCVNQTVPICMNQPIQLQQSTIQVNPGLNHHNIAHINTGLQQNNLQVNSLAQNIQVNPSSLLNHGNHLQAISINPSIAINQLNQQQPTPIMNQQQPLEFHQTQPVTIQSVPYNNPILNVAGQNQFTLNGNLITNPLVQTVNVPGAHWVQKINKHPTVIAQKAIKSRVRGRAIAAKRPAHFEEETLILPASNSGQVFVQHLPSTNFVPFVDAFQQQTGQNVQYVATLAPQVNTVPQSLVQIQPDNNIISIVPGLQPTMIIQQPRVLENQLVLDSNGTLGWTQVSQPQNVQPVYYGFETIVQNTVMQSQQFLPTTVPGVLTANSSYSTTTQVFQTSKLEPVLDVSSNSFVLVNPGQLVNSQVEVPQYSQTQPTTIMASQAPTLIYSQSSSSPRPSTIPASSTNNSITLPTAPFVSDQGIPMNIVTPIPKPPTSQSRPMSRVLPMPTNTIKPLKKTFVEDKKSFLEDTMIKKPTPIKALLSREVVKGSDTVAKIKPKKIEILEYKIIKNPLPPLMKSPESIKKEEKEFKDFESVEKIRKLEVYKKPLKEMENSKIQTYQEPVKSLKILEDEKFLKLDSFKNFSEVVKIEEKRGVTNNITKEVSSIEKTFEKLEELRKEHRQQESLLPIKEEPASQEKHVEFKTDSSLKLIFQKQGQDGTYKISNNFTKHPALVAPLRPIKSQTALQLKEEEKQKKVEEKLTTELSTQKANSSKKENEGAPSILYTVANAEGFNYSSSSVSDCWAKVIEAVQNARAAHNMPPLPIDSNSKKSLHILGIKSQHSKYLLEQLPGASKCTKYKPSFAFSPHPFDIEERVGHTYGAIRCKSKENKNSEPYDMFSWLSSKHRQPVNEFGDCQNIQSRRVNNLPLAMKFRNLKLTSKWSVGVYRSNIHGRGLFCLRDIDAGEMVIEYAGEVIRSILTDKREKLYNSKGIGCYMFRVDDNFVVDATMKGNAARFINHSCDPNCYSKVVEILGHKHIVIFALRRIIGGEELTYDYKFPFEEDKIPCTCGARKCRKFLN